MSSCTHSRPTLGSEKRERPHLHQGPAEEGGAEFVQVGETVSEVGKSTSSGPAAPHPTPATQETLSKLLNISVPQCPDCEGHKVCFIEWL